MSSLIYKLSYRNRLPDIQPPGAILFVTVRLAGQLPKAKQRELMAEKQNIETKLAQIEDPDALARKAYEDHRRMLGNWDNALDNVDGGPRWPWSCCRTVEE